MQNPRLASLFFVLSFLFVSILSGTNPWESISKASLNLAAPNRQIVPERYLTVSLDTATLKNILKNIPTRFSASTNAASHILDIPLPNGKMERFEIFSAPIMHPDLAVKFPKMQAFSGRGLDDKTATIRFDVTPFGFHAMISSAQYNTVFIDPFAKGDTENYIVYYRNDFSKASEFSCALSEEIIAPDFNSVEEKVAGDGLMRTYRLAVACSGEYSVFHGGTLSATMAAIHTSVTRITGIFEREVGVSFELVANNDEIIFLDPATDPFSGSDAFYFEQNQVVCDEFIGTENYDIGHMFGIGLGGSAQRSSCCVEGFKAQGASAIAAPVGDPFDIEFVAHEFGHQFGCSHPYGANCNSTLATSFEPGSGSTIMGTNFCNNTVQSLRDDYFQAINILEINDHIQNGPAGMCPETIDTGNTPPTVDAGESGYVLPISTPFKLTATGSDADADILTYCWEQMNNEESIDPPLPTNGQGPAFRSFPPVEAPFRYFPRLSDIVNGTTDIWEALPSVNWDLDFWVTVRDNAIGAGATNQSKMKLSFTETAGPFVVQNPNTATNWRKGAVYTVTWEVANTEKAPVNCELVDIFLSVDGGFTYPISLASGVPNDGAQPVLIDEDIPTTTTARVMVAAADNVFFDISNIDFSIIESNSTAVSIAPNPRIQHLCPPIGSVSYELIFSDLNGFDEEISLSATGVPAGANLSFSQNTLFAPDTITVLIEGLNDISPGSYPIDISAISANYDNGAFIYAIVENENTETVQPLSPINGATDVAIAPTFTWEDLGEQEVYFLEIATHPTFDTAIVQSQMTSKTSYSLTEELEPKTVYYWRVRNLNACDELNAPAPNNWFSFQTSANGCLRFTNDDPVFIHGFVNSASSVLTIEEEIDITDANVSMKIYHKNVGDLRGTLTSPSGNTVSLFDRPGFPTFDMGCPENNMLLQFDDSAASSADDLENMCLFDGLYAVEGTFQSLSPLSDLNGQSTLGDWVLTVEDERFGLSGSVEDWSIEFCFTGEIGALPDFSKTNVTVQPEESMIVTNDNLSASATDNLPADLVYTLTVLPQEGNLLLNGIIATLGATFTQADIDNGLLSYANTNANAFSDQFRFNLITKDCGWLGDEFLDINIGMVNTFEEEASQIPFQIFPNPAKENLTLELLHPTENALTIKLFDVFGKEVRTIRVEKNELYFQQQINLDDLPSGNYLLFLSDGKQIGRELFVKI